MGPMCLGMLSRSRRSGTIDSRGRPNKTVIGGHIMKRIIEELHPPLLSQRSASPVISRPWYCDQLGKVISRVQAMEC